MFLYRVSEVEKEEEEGEEEKGETLPVRLYHRTHLVA
jgi:hypothetical protein